MGALKGILVCAALSVAMPAKADGVAQWRPVIAEASARFGVPVPWIERVMSVESGGKTQWRGHPITSRAGAMGLMQLMPATWMQMRGALGLGPDPYAPRDNILAGTYYLQLMYGRFGYPGLFAAYNAGPGHYAAFVAGLRPLPRETLAYQAMTAGSRSGALESRGRRAGNALFFMSANRSDRIAAASMSDALFVRLGGEGVTPWSAR